MVSQYLLVIPGQQDHSFTKSFEKYGTVKEALNPDDLKAIVDQSGDPAIMVISSTMVNLTENIKVFRSRFNMTQLVVAGRVTQAQMLILQVDDIVRWPLPEDYPLHKEQPAGIPKRSAAGLPAWNTPQLPQSASLSTGENTLRGNERTIVVVSPEGGDGKSTITMNTARLFAKWGIAPLVIEADYTGSDWSWLSLNQPVRSILDFNDDRIWSREELESLLVSEDGIKLLPGSPSEKKPILVEHLDRAIRAFRQYYPVIIIDMHQGYSPMLRSVKEYATHILLVATQSEKKLPNVTFMVRRLSEMKVPKSKLRLVVNRDTLGNESLTRMRVALEDFGEIDTYLLPWHKGLSDDLETIYPALQTGKNDDYGRSFRKMVVKGLGIPNPRAKSESAQGKQEAVGSKLNFLARLFRKEEQTKTKRKRDKSS